MTQSEKITVALIANYGNVLYQTFTNVFFIFSTFLNSFFFNFYLNV